MIWDEYNACLASDALDIIEISGDEAVHQNTTCVTEAIRRSRNSDHLHNVANFSKERFTTTWASYRRFTCCATNLRTVNNNSVRGTGSTLISGTAKTTLEIQTAIRMLSGSPSSTDTARRCLTNH
jgi:hypothetical protein